MDFASSDNISKILREIANEEILRHIMSQMPDVILYDRDKRKEEIRKTIEDVSNRPLI